MAAAATGKSIKRECGFCLQVDDDLVDPKQLPCSHVHCGPCLKVAFDQSKVLRCPQCSQVFDAVPNAVPSAKVNNSSNISCDVCIKKNKNVSAVIYCGSCDKKFCSQHKQFHGEMHDDHQTCTIQEYKANANKMKIRFCDKHGDQPYNAGCRDCLSLCCVKCLSGLKNCTSTGASHKLLSIEELFAELMKNITKLTSDLVNKEGELSSLSKKAVQSISEFETETNTFIKLLHTTRDEQLQAITLEYQRLETQFMEQRRAKQAQMSKFLEENVDKALSLIHIQRLKLEAKIKQRHQVDVITQYKQTKSEFGQLIGMEMPELTLEIPTLHTLDSNRNIEIQIGQKYLIAIAPTPSLPTYWEEPVAEPRQVFLEPGSAEYQQVLKSFNTDDRCSIPGGAMRSNNRTQIEIYRIQNADHYRKYAANKTVVSKQQRWQGNEVETSSLWFQTKESDIPSIVSGNLMNEHRQGFFGGRPSISLYLNARDAGNHFMKKNNCSGVYVRARAITETLQDSQTGGHVYSSSTRASKQNMQYNGQIQWYGSPQRLNQQPPRHYETCDNTAVYPEYVIIANSF